MGCDSSTSVSIECVNTTPYNIGFFGLPNVGKTTIIENIFDEYNSEYPPAHTNGIIMRDMVLANIKYRFFDTSGYFSHQEEWAKVVSQCDGVIFVTDKAGITDGFFFTTELTKILGPLFVQCHVPVFILCVQVEESDAVLHNIKKLQSNYFNGLDSSFQISDDYPKDISTALNFLKMHFSKSKK